MYLVVEHDADDHADRGNARQVALHTHMTSSTDGQLQTSYVKNEGWIVVPFNRDVLLKRCRHLPTQLCVCGVEV